MRVEFSKHAQQDLLDIVRFMALDDVDVAIALSQELRGAALQLETLSLRFPLVFNGSPPVRRRSYRNYAIFYLPQENQVTILRITHGSRVTDRFLEDL